MEVEEFDAVGGEPELLRGVHAAVVATERDLLPDDPPTPFGELVDDLTHRYGSRRKRHWVVRVDGRVAGAAELRMDLVDNLHLGWAQLVVHPEQRGRGAGTALMRALVDATEAEGRSVLAVFLRRQPPVTAFLSGLGFAEKLVETQSRLVVADVDVDLLRRWVARAPERASGYVLRAWDDRTPPELLEAFAEAQHIMNSAPREDLDMDDETMTPDRLRDREEAFFDRGQRWWTVAAVERATGRVVGFTDLYFTRWRDDVAFQGNTGVDPAHRGRGIGRWIKAAMLLRLLDERPSVRRVDTYNAASNEAMLRINVEMGFRPLTAWSDWQAGVEAVARRLDARAAGLAAG